jgi:Tfp pilus assembly protein PilF
MDDSAYVVDNPHIKSGLDWSTISWALTAYYQSNWHPLTWLSHALDVQMFQLDPGGHHSTNLLLHVVNVLLLFWVLLRATGYVGRSAMVAALFALHPINVESVAWISQRKNLLSMVFFLLALEAYRRYVIEPRVGRYVLVALLFALGLMAKPQVITFPFVLLLWDYWPLRRMAVPGSTGSSQTAVASQAQAKSFSWLAREKIPLFAMCVVSAVLTVIAQKKGGAVGSLDYFPLSVRWENAIVSYARYVGKALWPAHLAPLYPHPLTALRSWQVIAALLFLVAVSGLVVAERRKRPYLLVGWLWFLGTLAPMIGIVQVGVQAMADRYAYLSFVGLFIMVVWGVADLDPLTRETGVSVAARDGARPSRFPVLFGVGSVAVLFVLAALTYHQLGYWSANLDLWMHTLQVTSRNSLAEDSLALALMEQGRDQEAINHFRTALSIYPFDPVANLQIAAYDHQHGQLREALERYTQLMSIVRGDTGKSEMFTHRGFVYLDLREYANARKDFEAAAALNAKNSRPWLGLGILAQKSGDLQLAIKDYSRSNEAKPSDITYLLLARALEQSGRNDEARQATEHAKLLTHNLDASRIIADGLLAH